MVILRATRKVLRNLPAQGDSDGSSDTALGDWYVDRVMIGRHPLLLLVSSRSFLPILTWARDVRSLPSRLPDLVGERLERMGIPTPLIDAEIAAMAPVHVAKTVDRSVVGILVNYASAVPYYIPSDRTDDLAHHFAEAELQQTPWLPGKNRPDVVYPDQKTLELLMQQWNDVRRS